MGWECGGDGQGWVLGMIVVAGTGVPASLWEPFLSLWMGLWRLLGSDWAQIGHHASKLEYWESLLVSPGCTLGGLRSSWMPFRGHLVSIWVPWASEMGAAGDHADTAKTIETH